MSTHATITSEYLIPATPGTPVDLGASTVRFNELILRGYKAKGTVNTGNVYYRPEGGEWVTIEPGTEFRVPIAGWIRADQVEIDSVQSGDGVQYVATAAVVYEGP
jgi:hypothetical protein